MLSSKLMIASNFMAILLSSQIIPNAKGNEYVARFISWQGDNIVVIIWVDDNITLNIQCYHQAG
jgi:hypothetical protein